MRVLVTGGAGFLGHWVREELVRRGHEPVIFDTANNIQDDVRRTQVVQRAVAEVDGVIHLAAVLGTQETVDNPFPSILTNVVGTANVLEACRQKDKPLVYVATGNAWMRSLGAGAYPITKECAADLATMYRINHGLRVNIVRPMNAYGPWQKVAPPLGDHPVRKIVVDFVTRAIAGLPIQVYGDGRQVSDCVWVGDVADAIVDALGFAATGTIFSRVLEVGPETHRTVRQVAEMVRDLGEPTACIEYLPMRRGEVEGVTLTEGGSPYARVPLTEGIRRTVHWYRETRGTWWDAGH